MINLAAAPAIDPGNELTRPHAEGLGLASITTMLWQFVLVPVRVLQEHLHGIDKAPAPDPNLNDDRAGADEWLIVELDTAVTTRVTFNRHLNLLRWKFDTPVFLRATAGPTDG
jgi:hypothetical protein